MVRHRRNLQLQKVLKLSYAPLMSKHDWVAFTDSKLTPCLESHSVVWCLIKNRTLHALKTYSQNFRP